MYVCIVNQATHLLLTFLNSKTHVSIHYSKNSPSLNYHYSAFLYIVSCVYMTATHADVPETAKHFRTACNAMDPVGSRSSDVIIVPCFPTYVQLLSVIFLELCWRLRKVTLPSHTEKHKKTLKRWSLVSYREKKIYCWFYIWGNPFYISHVVGVECRCGRKAEYDTRAFTRGSFNSVV